MNVPLLHRAIVVLFCATGVLGCGGPPPAPSGVKKAVAAKVIPGKDTTYIVGPLSADDYVDYVAAINDTASKGVTAENNAAVLLVRACGLQDLSDSHRDEFFRRLFAIACVGQQVISSELPGPKKETQARDSCYEKRAATMALTQPV